jgi:hypothetical protein
MGSGAVDAICANGRDAYLLIVRYPGHKVWQDAFITDPLGESDRVCDETDKVV